MALLFLFLSRSILDCVSFLLWEFWDLLIASLLSLILLPYTAHLNCRG